MLSRFNSASISETLGDLARDYVRLLGERYGDNLAMAILFGSVARGTAKVGSDIDLLLAFHELPSGRMARRNYIEPEPAEVEARIIALMKQNLPTRINAHLKTTTEALRPSPLFFFIARDGVVLRDTDALFPRLQNHVRDWQTRLGVEVRTLGKLEYLELKPDMHFGEEFHL